MDISITLDISPASAKNLAEAFKNIIGSGCTEAASSGAQTGTAAGTTPAPKTKAKEKATPPAVTLEDLRGAATKVVDAGKKDLLAPALAKFGAKKITELKPEQYAEALAAFEAAAVAVVEEDPMA